MGVGQDGGCGERQLKIWREAISEHGSRGELRTEGRIALLQTKIEAPFPLRVGGSGITKNGAVTCGP